jgi:hypothetical protein
MENNLGWDKGKKRLSWVITSLLIAPLLASQVKADPIPAINLQEPYALFGHLANITGRCGAGGLCAPTATVNSFDYLLNKFPGVYGGSNIIRSNDLALTRDMLAGGWFAPTGNPPPRRPGTGDQGASVESWWQGKLQWVMDFAPGTTQFAGMVNQDTAGWFTPSSLTDALPTFPFLETQLTDKEDIEFEITYTGVECVDNNGKPIHCAHALTLTGITAANPDGTGARTITYLDPNAPGSTITADLITNADGSLGFLWNNGANPPRDASIQATFAESPIPEPSTILLLSGFSLAWLGAGRRRR